MSHPLQEVALEGPTGKLKQHSHSDPETGDMIAARSVPEQGQTVKAADAQPGHRWSDNIPWASMLLCKVCASFLGIGCWLLFGTNGLQGNEQ